VLRSSLLSCFTHAAQHEEPGTQYTNDEVREDVKMIQQASVDYYSQFVRIFTHYACGGDGAVDKMDNGEFWAFMSVCQLSSFYLCSVFLQRRLLRCV
jgi:hypothetical protein